MSKITSNCPVTEKYIHVIQWGMYRGLKPLIFVELIKRITVMAFSGNQSVFRCLSCRPNHVARVSCDYIVARLSPIHTADADETVLSRRVPAVCIGH